MANAFLYGVGGGAKALPEQEKQITITENTTTEVTPDDGKSLSKVSIVTDVTPVLQDKVITENGVVTADDGYDGLSKVLVAVPTGGGSSVSPKDVNFYDYDGTLLHSYTVEEAQALTELPELPTQEGLICQGWNWTLEDIKSYNREIEVGASYITDDGKTRFYITIPSEDLLEIPLYFRQSIPNGVIIDWGDGSATETLSGGSSQDLIAKHNYATTGDYVIALEVVDGCEITFGYSAYSLFGVKVNNNGPLTYANMLKKAEFGRNIVTTGAACTCCSSLTSVTSPRGLTSIGNFKNCYLLSSITIPDGVTSLNEGAFSACYSLSSISLPNSVQGALTNNIFNNIPASRITLPNGVNRIDQGVFTGCRTVKTLKIPDGVTQFGQSAFGGCTELSSIEMPSRLTSMGYYVFQNCYKLKSIKIKGSLTSIVGDAFNSCLLLSSVELPDSVTSINMRAFQSCRALKSIVLPKNLTTLGSYAFNGCSALSDIVIPSRVTSISSYVFQNCYALTSIEIPNGVTTINQYTFNGCTSLRYVKIPASVTSITTYVFQNCYAMKVYDFTSHTSVPSLSNKNSFTGIPADCEIRVPASLYDAWKSATNWSTSSIVSHIVPV